MIPESLSALMIRRRGAPQEDSSDEEEDDIFAKMAKGQPPSGTANPTAPPENPHARHAQPIVPSVTSSMKRHHTAMSNTRKKEMDSLIQELEIEKTAVLGEPRGFVPKKRGSYVDPEEEHLTTNLFVGNLAPSLTEDVITDVFAKFGDLSSLKVMWPRTAEEFDRNRVSCFVCYRYRRDAEAAMDACNESDPFHVGRRLMVRWGKNLHDKNPDEQTAKKQRSEGHDEHEMEFSYKPAKDYPSKLSYRVDRRRHRRPVDGRWELEPDDLAKFHILTRQRLCASRKSICEAMAFCFEQSNASDQISDLLKDLLLERNCSVETHVARLYLLSDVLFNSQQPGIKNAFRYRDAIEKMAPSVFASLGEHGDAARGRMTRHKLQLAIRAVLAAWTNWSVFDPSFLDELEACFDSREIIKVAPSKEDTIEDAVVKDEEKEETDVIILSARGDWTDVNEGDDVAVEQLEPEVSGHREGPKKEPTDEPTQLTENCDCKAHDDSDIDGEPLEDGDLDEEGLRRLHAIHHVTDDEDTDSKKGVGNQHADNMADGSDVDGEPLSEEDVLESTAL